MVSVRYWFTYIALTIYSIWHLFFNRSFQPVPCKHKPYKLQSSYSYLLILSVNLRFKSRVFVWYHWQVYWIYSLRLEKTSKGFMIKKWIFFFFFDKPVSHQSKLQTKIAPSSIRKEYIAITEAEEKALCIAQFIVLLR